MTTLLARKPGRLLSNHSYWITIILVLGWGLGMGGLQSAEGASTLSVSPEDCVPIQSEKVQVVDEGRGDFVVTDGKHRLAKAASRTAAERMAAIAARHEQHCFIGRDSGKGEVVEYWKGRSDVDVEMPPSTDCHSYNQDRLRSEKTGGGFVVTDGTKRLFTLATRGEVRQAIQWAREHKQYCYIGRDNNRYDHAEYVIAYWAGGEDGDGTYLDESSDDTYLDDSGEEDTYLDDSGGGDRR